MRSQIFTARRCSALFLLLGVGLLAGSGYVSRAESSGATTHASAVLPTSGRHSGTAPSAPLASIDLSAETITANSANASISPIDFGSDISLTIPNRAAPLSYDLSIPLSSDESLTVLAAGGAAITQTYPIPPGDYPGLYPPADYQDSSRPGPELTRSFRRPTTAAVISRAKTSRTTRILPGTRMEMPSILAPATAPRSQVTP